MVPFFLYFHACVLNVFLDAIFYDFKGFGRNMDPQLCFFWRPFSIYLFNLAHQGCLGRFIGSLWFPFSSFWSVLDTFRVQKLTFLHIYLSIYIYIDIQPGPGQPAAWAASRQEQERASPTASLEPAQGRKLDRLFGPRHKQI